MRKIEEKQLLVGADFAGYPLKEAVCSHLRKKGWIITDIGVKADSDPNDTDLMFHRVGLRVGSMISEGEFERALIFCGTGMGIHIAASKMSPCSCRGCWIGARRTSRDYGQWRERSCNGSILRCAADGL